MQETIMYNNIKRLFSRRLLCIEFKYEEAKLLFFAIISRLNNNRFEIFGLSLCSNIWPLILVTTFTVVLCRLFKMSEQQ